MNIHLNNAISTLGGLSKFSKAIGVRPPTVSEWSTGKRPVPIKRCVQIEKLTGGVVTRKDLRPNDYHEIWTDIDDKETYDE